MQNPHYLMQYFAYEHLPEHLKHTSKAFHDLALKIDENHTENSEKTVALRKLLEAKDCAVRSRIFTHRNPGDTMQISSDGSHLV